MSPDSANLIIPLFGWSNTETMVLFILSHKLKKKETQIFLYTHSKIIKLYYFFLAILWKPKENQLQRTGTIFLISFFLCGLFSACKHTWETLKTYYFFWNFLILFQSTLLLLLFINFKFYLWRGWAQFCWLLQHFFFFIIKSWWNFDLLIRIYVVCLKNHNLKSGNYKLLLH